jgi:hypothetical protein
MTAWDSRKGTHNPSRIAHHHGAAVDALGDDAPGANDYIVADHYAGQDNHVGTEPHIIANDNRITNIILSIKLELGIIKTVILRMDYHPRSYKDMIADSNSSAGV